VADRGWCFGTVAWFKSLCVWAALAPMRAGLGSPHWHWLAAAVVRLLRPRCPEWAARPTTVVSSGVLVGLGGVCVATPWLVREPRGWGFRGCGGGGWGAAVWWAASWAQARGQLATETCTPGQCQWHAAARMPFKPDTASFRAVRCVVGGKKPILPLRRGVCKQPAQPVANEDAEHARFSDSRLLSRGRANCWKSVH